MRRVLLLAYHFPPVGGAGVQRTVKFARYLPEHGWEPAVVTGPPESVGDADLKDPTLADELPDDLPIARLPGPEPSRGGRRGRAERWLRMRSAWATWWREGAVAVGADVKGVEAVFATMSPFESCEPAARLAAVHRVPWIADLRDPWALDEMRVYPSRAHRRLERRRMRIALAGADAVIMNTEEAASALRREFPELAAKLIAVIPNGYDASDFAGEPRPRVEDAFRIVHTGELHTAFGIQVRRRALVRRILGGGLGDVDVLPRSHVFLLQAVERARNRTSLPIEVHLAGGVDPDDRAAAPADYVSYHGYVTHGEAVGLMRSADLLFLPMHDLPAGRRARIVPGKTYEYLASGTPILAAVPDGDARDLLRRAGSARLCRPTSVACMAEAIVALADEKTRGGTPVPVSPDLLRSLERRQLTAELAALLDEVVHRFGPRAA